MSNPFKNVLDLRTKEEPEVVVVEKIILKKRSFWKESFRTLAVIAIVSTIVYGISHADIITPPLKTESVTKNFSAIGLVSEISNTSLTISPAKGPSYNEQDSYTVDISNTTKILTNTSDELSLTDIQVGDKIIIQGTDKEESISINRIISFAPRFPDTEDNARFMEPNIDLGEVTTTPDVSTTTPDVATTTPPTSDSVEPKQDTATTTPSFIETITDTVSDIVDTVTETISTVIDTVTEATTPPEVIPTEETPAPADTPVVDTTPTE